MKYTTARDVAETALKPYCKRFGIQHLTTTVRPEPNPHSNLNQILKLPARELLNLMRDEKRLSFG